MTTTNTKGLEAEIKIRHGKFLTGSVYVGPVAPGGSYTLSTVHLWERIVAEAQERLAHARSVHRSVDSEERLKTEKLLVIHQWMIDTGMSAKALDRAMSRLARYGIHSEVWKPFMMEGKLNKNKLNKNKLANANNANNAKPNKNKLANANNANNADVTPKVTPVPEGSDPANTTKLLLSGRTRKVPLDHNSGG